MKKSTVEHVLSYYDRLADYLESRWISEDSEELRSSYEILLGEKLDPKLPSPKAAFTIVRTRLAAVFGKLKEPTSEELKQLEELERRAKRISRSGIWKILKVFVVALIPRRRGHRPAPTIKESDFPKIIAAVEGVASKYPRLKRWAIYEEVAKKFGTSWRTIQDAYLETTKPQKPKAR